jgi:hypothetical protein
MKALGRLNFTGQAKCSTALGRTVPSAMILPGYMVAICFESGEMSAVLLQMP